jgi:signal transduction histidine kinase
MDINNQISELKMKLSAESQKESSDNNVILSLSEQIKKLELSLSKDPNANSKIPFKVSARTARLIGRENIATSKGAIIELVKNGYDADSKVSIVYFDNQYSTFQNEISTSHFQTLLDKGIDNEVLLNVYSKNEDAYILKADIEDGVKSEFKKTLAKFSTLYIIDSGEGMTQNVIRENWMTIGTDNKAIDVFTKTGRVKAGAKGIGRFALDKLGSRCEMTTIFNPENHKTDTDEFGIATQNNGYKWIVNWEDFEGEFKTIDNVNAELEGVKALSLKHELVKILPQFDLTKIANEPDFKFGTILKITELRDNWEDFFVDQVYSDLEVLVPPKESGGFEIYLFSSLTPDKYGEVFGSICDDFDYKITATADENQNVKITVYRREYDVETIAPELFSREAMKIEPFRKKDFVEGFWKTEKTFSQLLPGYAQVDEDRVFNDIGVFDFSFYFLKRAFNTPDANRFFYRKFLSNNRKDWLDKFGGVKLFRDNFRVRPYGETKDVAFDWLELGNRKAASPAGIGKKEGGYRVEPENVAGAIKISRLTNVNFEDKSSREGLQENTTFQIFKKLIAAIINILETDRAYIAREMAMFDDERFGPERSRQEAEAIAKRILNESRAKKIAKANDTSSNPTTTSQPEDIKDQELAIIAELNEKKDEEIEKLKEEQKVLRGLASSGIVLASFSHDLSKLNNVLNSRVDKLKNLFSEKILEADYAETEERKNPFAQLEKMRKQDLKLQNWLNFSLGAARKDKRKRKQLFLLKYFNDFKIDWTTILENRAIDFDISKIEDIDLRVFEIDFDSIFNNLLVNSIDAFNLSTINRVRTVSISVASNSKEIVIDYYDNGPGLSQDIEKADKIFEPLFTTKRNAFTGEEEGTGLGMWLVKSIVEENDGIVKLLFPENGFGLRISFPIKYKR